MPRTPNQTLEATDEDSPITAVELKGSDWAIVTVKSESGETRRFPVSRRSAMSRIAAAARQKD